MCSILGAARPTFYGWRRQVTTVTTTVARRAELVIEVGKVFEEFQETQGRRSVEQVSNELGHASSAGVVADVMREVNLKAVQPRAYRVTTLHAEGGDYPGNLLDRDFTSNAPSTRLVGEITYFRTGEGWLDLAPAAVG